MDTKEKPLFNLFHAPILSFFSSEFYKDVVLRWKGIGISYLCLLTLLFTLPEAVKMHRDLSHFLSLAGPKVISQFPVMTLKDGKLSINSPSPHKIYYKDKQPIAIIDTSKTYKGPNEAKTYVYITDSHLFIKRSEDTYSQIELSRFGDIVIDHHVLNRWLEFIRQTFMIVFGPVLYLIALFYFFMHVLVCASVGSIMAKKIYPEANYVQLMRLSSVALTPPVMLQIIHILLEIDFPYSGPITLAFTLCYVYFGLKSSSDKKTTVHQH